MTTPIVRVAVPSPLRKTFDYWGPAGAASDTLRPGIRVRVPFGKTSRVAIILAQVAESPVGPERLRAIERIIDERPVIPPSHLNLLKWVADYYHHPVGEVIFSSMPALLRKGGPTRVTGIARWRLTTAGAGIDPRSLARAPRQARLLVHLGGRGEGLISEQLTELMPGWRAPARALEKKGWVKKFDTSRISVARTTPGNDIELSPSQLQAVNLVAGVEKSFQAFLLEGVTGSGKTEVYLRLIQRVLAAGRQALVLIPEIGLTPQMVRRFRDRIASPVAVLHSGLSDRDRLCAWLMAGDGKAGVVIGTRSAVFAPLKAPGIIIVDEEHDLSFKQQEGFRYSARDLAVARGLREGVPVLLGTATPSLESLHNVIHGRYRRLELPERVTACGHPRLRILDVRNRPLKNGLSDPLLAAIAARLGGEEQVLLFLNRRGYSPTVLCHHCGWVVICRRCDAHMTYHSASRRLRCHHCGAERPMVTHCAECGLADLRHLGKGTERIEEILRGPFPTAGIVRVDRDSTRKKGALDGILAKVHAGRADILIGTQMLAKGHHFPNVTLVGILDADGGLFSADFRASERMAQLVVQVAGRAGRGERPGEVLIQTHQPEHPLLLALVEHGYPRFASAALRERQDAGLPPYSSMALLRSEAAGREVAEGFLAEAHRVAGKMDFSGIQVLGPVPAPMERRAGRYRFQLLVQSPARGALQRFLSAWLPLIEDLKIARRVRWSLDVDPQEMT